MLIGVDIGTSSSKAILMRENGDVAAAHGEEYGITTRFPGWAEQNPDMWFEKAALCVRRVAAAAGGDVKGIAFSGQMHGIVLVDREHKPLGEAILWADGRAGVEVKEISEIIGEDVLRGVTLNRLAAGYGLASLYWLRKHDPQRIEKAAAVLCPKDYVRGRFTENFAQEISDASATCCLDVVAGKWAWSIIDALKLPRTMFPAIHRSTECAGGLNAESAALCGLPAGIPVYCGGADSSMAGIGAGVVEEGVLGLNIGTGGQVSAILREPLFDAEYRASTFCHPIPGHWIAQGSTLCAGLALKWFRDAFCPGKDFSELSTMAGRVPAGSEGLLFLPYLAGERTPWFDPAARGMFAGLSLRHGMPEMVRAVMEGVTLALEQSFGILKNMGVAGRRIISMGGGAKSPEWLQMQADVFGLPVHAAVGDACVGAAITAGVGCGVYADFFEGCRVAVGGNKKISIPDDRNHASYRECKEAFRALYENNRSPRRP